MEHHAGLTAENGFGRGTQGISPLPREKNEASNPGSRRASSVRGPSEPGRAIRRRAALRTRVTHALAQMG